MDGCEGRDVASEQQLIQAWADGCSLIHCQETTTISPEFFFALTEPLATNITLTGTLVLDWISDLEDLLAVRHAFNNGTVDQSASRQLLPIRYNNWLKMSDLHLLGWPTSMGLFMEMLTAVPPGPGMLLLENTTWTVLDCTDVTSFLNYLAFPAWVRPDVFPALTEEAADLNQLSWDPATATMTIPLLLPTPLRPADARQGNWTAGQTVSMSNFSIACSSSADYLQLQLSPELPADPSRCLSRQVTTGRELVQARLDDCRHVLALPAYDSNGMLQALPLLSQDWFQWDRSFSVYTTLSGVVQLDVIRAASVKPITYPIAADAVLDMWYLDVVGSVAEGLKLGERSRLAGYGTLRMTNTRFIITGCVPELMALVENVVLTLQVFSLASDGPITNDVTIDREQASVVLSRFSGGLENTVGLGGVFGQKFTWDVSNTTIMCLLDWDIQESVNRALAIRDVVPPSLQPEALAAGSTGSGGDVVPTAQDPQAPSSEGSGGNRPIGIVFGVGAAVALILAVVWLAVWFVRRHDATGAAGGETELVQVADNVAEPGSGSERLASSNAPAASAPLTLALHEELHQQLLASETCMDLLASQAPLESIPLPNRIRPSTSTSSCATAKSLVTDALSSSSSGALRLLVRAMDQESGTGCSNTEEAEDTEESLQGGRAQPSFLSEQARAALQDVIIRLLPQRAEVDLEVDLNRDVKLGRILGEGGYGVVHEGWWRPGSEEERHVAVKVLDMDAIGSARERQRFLRAFSRELDTLSRIRHPSIVQCYGGSVTETSVCVVLEYLPAGTLAEYVHRDRADNPLSVPEVLAIALQVASALSHLHPLVIHGDVKPDNCLLTANGHVKLGDFGESKFKWQTAIQPSTVLGTPAYTAPEVLNGEMVNEKCDVYSLALLLWECCTGRRPWKDVDNPIQLCKLVADEEMRPEIPDGLDPSMVALIEKCWHQKPELRLSAAEVVRKADLLLRTAEKWSSGRPKAAADGQVTEGGAV